MRIVLDLQSAQSASRFRGIGRYATGLAKAIARNRGKHEVFIVLSNAFPDTIRPLRDIFEDIIGRDHIFVFSTPSNISYITPNSENARKVAEVIRESFIASLHPDVVHVFSMFESFGDDCVTSVPLLYTGVLNSVSLYDLIPLVLPESSLPSELSRQWYNEKLVHFKKCDLFLSISESSRDEGIKYGGLKLSDVISISSGVDDFFHRIEINKTESAELCKKYNIKKSFILYSGGVETRKNIKNLISAYALLDKNLKAEYQCVVVCGKHEDIQIDLLAFAKSLKLDSSEIIFTCYISDSDLRLFYNLCKLFVFPSLYEGFGLPVLEAMSCGAPVISSNRASLPEVVGFDRAMFNPEDIAEIASKITEVLINTEFYDALKLHSQIQSQKFSWDKSAIVAISAFEKFQKKPIQHNINAEVITDAIARYLKPQTESHCLEIISQCIADNLLVNKTIKTIFVDISELVQKDAKTGIQRVTRSILKQLVNNPPLGYCIEPVYAIMTSDGYKYAKKFMATFTGRESNESDDLIDAGPYDIFLGLDLQPNIVVRQIEHLDAMFLRGTHIYFVVYDLLPLIMPDMFPKGLKEAYVKWLHSISQFDGALCISKTIANELSIWQKDSEISLNRSYKIGHFYLSGDLLDSIPTNGLPNGAFDILDKLEEHVTIVSVSTIEPRKGYSNALDAMDRLWNEGIDLIYVMVGKVGWNVESLCSRIEKHPELNKRLFWLRGISDEYLYKIYESSTVVLLPSCGEGFGLAIVEAARFNKPVIVRDLPVFHELAGDSAYYFKDDLAGSVKEWLNLYEKGEHPIPNNIVSISWSDSTNMLLKNILD